MFLWMYVGGGCMGSGHGCERMMEDVHGCLFVVRSLNVGSEMTMIDLCLLKENY